MNEKKGKANRLFFTQKVTLKEWEKEDFLQPSNMEILAHKVDLNAGFAEIAEDFFSNATT